MNLVQMKLKQQLLPILLTLALALLALPVLAQAQIYKWKDKDGVTRYSDTPPTDTLHVDKIGQSSAAKPEPIVAKPDAKARVNPKDKAEWRVDPDLAARARAEKAEQEKQRKEQEAEHARDKAENCRSAEANYKTFAQGGRIYEMDANGERHYFDDAALNARKAQADVKVQQYCY